MTEQDLQDLPIGQLIALVETLRATNAQLSVKADERGTKYGEIMHDVFNAIKASITRATNDDVLETEDAEGIFDMFATRLNFEDKWKNPFAKKWRVKVKYNDGIVLVVSNVVADDEDDAISEVESNLSVEDLSMTCKLSYTGEYDEDEQDELEHDSPDWDATEDVTFTAELMPAEA